MIRFDNLPEGADTITPMLTVNNGKAMIEFYKKAFGAEEVMCANAPDSDKVMHASLQIGGSRFSLNDEFPQQGGSMSPATTGHSSTMLHIQVSEGMDELYRQALAAGAVSVMEPADMFWGDRFAMVTDPSGHRWSLGMAIPNPPKMSDEELKAMTAS